VFFSLAPSRAQRGRRERRNVSPDNSASVVMGIAHPLFFFYSFSPTRWLHSKHIRWTWAAHSSHTRAFCEHSNTHLPDGFSGDDTSTSVQKDELRGTRSHQIHTQAIILL
jgi:hypothetical protein